MLEGALVETPSAGSGGVERRAFGEFVGPRGELASYGLGWHTGSESHVGRLTIGLGVGDPGGGTFHAIVVDRDGKYAFSLVDDPFARVPQGGPDLTAEQARAHEDLPFVWWVADHVMRRDRRAGWMRHWLLRTACLQTLEVFEHREPVLLVSHDADDGTWQLIGATDADPATGKLAHLHHAVAHDHTLLDVLDLPPGRTVTREGPDRPWTARL